MVVATSDRFRLTGTLTGGKTAANLSTADLTRSLRHFSLFWFSSRLEFKSKVRTEG